MEKRLLLAFVLSAAILLTWSVVFPPPERQPPTAPEAVPSAVAPAKEPMAASSDGTSSPGATEMPAVPEELEAAPPTNEVIVSLTEQEIELANDQILVVLTNRGAAVSSYRLRDMTMMKANPLI